MDYFKILPEEITLDILTRLPAESVLHCKLVCSQWRSLVRHPWFSKMHLYHLNHPSHSAATRSGKLGFIAFTGDKNFHYFENHDHSRTPIHRITMINFTPPFKSFRFVGSCNGLICLLDLLSKPSSVWICNPITREYVMVPKINTHSVGFGYVSSTSDYKVVGMYMPNKFHYMSVESKFVEVHIYTLGNGNGWRNLGKFNFQFNPRYDYETGTFANGALYWIDTELKKIITFDLSEEKFSEHISPPSWPPHSSYDTRIGVLDGFLYFAVYLWVGSVMINDIWLLKKNVHNHDLKEGEKHQSLVWSKEFRIDISKLFAVTKSSDRVLTYGLNGLNIYDTKSSTSKRLVMFKGGILQVSPHQNTFVSLREIGENDIKVIESVELEESISPGYSLEPLQEDAKNGKHINW